MTQAGGHRWWESRAYFWGLILAAFVPLLWPSIPPLGDLPAHMARYRVAMGGGPGDPLSQWYLFRWVPIGNLGVDILVVPLAKYIGLDLATKMVVSLIPPLTVAGMQVLTREVHGRLPATAGFAVPLAYGFPFLFGFVNFCLSMALMLLALALWIRLGRQNRRGLRAALFLPIALIVFFAHIVGWGVLGLTCFAVEWVRRREDGAPRLSATIQSALAMLPLCGPLVILLAWRSSEAGDPSLGWFAIETKLFALSRILCDRWKFVDLLFLLALFRVAVFPVSKDNGVRVAPMLKGPAIILFAAFLILPHQLFGSSYADSRLIGYALMFWLLAFAPSEKSDVKRERAVALAAVLFVGIRLASVTASFVIADRDWKERIAVVATIEPGSRVASLVNLPCNGWAIPRNSHLGSFALMRRSSFSNDQWSVAGSRLLTINRPDAGKFAADPSELATWDRCPNHYWPMKAALAHLPSDAFDYLWLVDWPVDRPPPGGWNTVVRLPNSHLLKRDIAAPAG